MVIAIEPDPQNVAILRNNIARNKLSAIVQVLECAVYDVAGKALFHPEGSQGRLFAKSPDSEIGKFAVEIETLKDIIVSLSIDRVDLLIVDVEGAELPVLKGFPWEQMQPERLF